MAIESLCGIRINEVLPVDKGAVVELADKDFCLTDSEDGCPTVAHVSLNENSTAQLYTGGFPVLGVG